MHFDWENGDAVPFSNALATSNWPLRTGKGFASEGGLREPPIIRMPGVTRAGRIRDTPMIKMDFFPTSRELAARLDAWLEEVGVQLPVVRKG